MHLKNFSLLQRDPKRWELSPAYDLVPVKVILPQDSEEMALTVNGKKNRLTRGDFEALGVALKLSPIQIQRTIQRITQAIERHLDDALQRSFLPLEMQTLIKTLMTRRLQRLA
jgi:serine/threonine-protein kinase HipA